MSRTDRILGALTGLAVGDALGYPVEGWTREQIQATYGKLSDYVESPTSPPERWRLPGLHSDDTQQALAVADVLLNEGRADPDAICLKFLELAEGPPHLTLGAHRGAGRNFRYTIQALRGGAPWDQGSRHSAGVGASMRVAPVGLALGVDDAAVRDNSALQALVTHNDPRAVGAAFLVAHVVGRLVWIPPATLDGESFLREETDYVRRSEEWLIEAHGRHLARESRPVLHHMSEALAGISGQINRSPEEVLPGVAERASALAGYTIEHPCRGFAPAGVVSAFYFFLHYRGDFEAAMVEAINWGGDVDTVGAILGAMCGAHGGIGTIPQRWIEPLRGFDLVRSRALAFAGERTEFHARRDLAEIELGWTIEEDRLRRERTDQPPVDSSDWVRQPVVREIPPRIRDVEGEYADRSEMRGRDARETFGGSSESEGRDRRPPHPGSRGGRRGPPRRR